MFCKKGILKSCAKFTGKHLCQSLSFNKKEDGINEIIIAIKRETNTCSFGYVYGLMYQELRQMVVTTDRKNVRLVSKAL